MAEERPVYEMLLDCLLYAPLGAAVVFVEEVPRLAERGRERIAVARLVGKFAAEEARRRLRAPSSGPSREQAHRSKEGSQPGFFTPNDAVPTKTPATASASPGISDHDAAEAQERAQEHGDSRPTGAVAPGARTLRRPAASVSGRSASQSSRPAAAGKRRSPESLNFVASTIGPELPIPAYDTLAASQVVERLASLTAAELETVRKHESAGRQRRTVLHRIAQLSSERDGATT
ncbi:MAG: hypothetical protein WAV54_08695 [Acidimicrobiales bacterium]